MRAIALANEDAVLRVAREIAESGESPTIDRIAERTGISPKKAWVYRKRLQAEGRWPGMANGIEARRADYEARVLAAAAAIEAEGRYPSTLLIGSLTGFDTGSVSRVRLRLIEAGRWPHASERPPSKLSDEERRAAKNAKNAAYYRANKKKPFEESRRGKSLVKRDLVLATAEAIEAEGGIVNGQAIAERTGFAASTVCFLRKQLVESGLWRWEVGASAPRRISANPRRGYTRRKPMPTKKALIKSLWRKLKRAKPRPTETLEQWQAAASHRLNPAN